MKNDYMYKNLSEILEEISINKVIGGALILCFIIWFYQIKFVIKMIKYKYDKARV